MRPIHVLLLAAAIFFPSMAPAAQSNAAPLPPQIRLSEEEKERVLEEAAAGRREKTAADSESSPQIHGEVGFTIGTGGYRSAYGTAVVPLEGDGVAIISLGSTDFGSRRHYPDPWWR